MCGGEAWGEKRYEKTCVVLAILLGFSVWQFHELHDLRNQYLLAKAEIRAARYGIDPIKFEGACNWASRWVIPVTEKQIAATCWEILHPGQDLLAHEKDIERMAELQQAEAAFTVLQ
jgi:hypothetical protein